MLVLLLSVLLVAARAQINPGNQFFSGPLAPAPLTPQGQPPPDGVAQYTYGYKTEDPAEATYSEQNEQRNGNAVTGFYSTLLPDGRVQVVNYVADEGGYRATVAYQTPDGIPLPAPQQPPGSPPPRAEPRQPTFLFSGPLPPLTADLGPGFGRRVGNGGEGGERGFGGGEGGLGGGPRGGGGGPVVFGGPAKREAGTTGGPLPLRVGVGQNGPVSRGVQGGSGRGGPQPLSGGRPQVRRLKTPGPRPNQPAPQQGRSTQPAAQHVRPNQPPAQHVRPNQPPAQHVGPDQSPAQHARPNLPPAQHTRPNQPPAQRVRPNQPPAQHARPNQPPAQHARPNQPPAPHGGRPSLQQRRLPVRPAADSPAPWSPEANTVPTGGDRVPAAEHTSAAAAWRLPSSPPPPPAASAWLVADNTIKHGWTGPAGGQPGPAASRTTSVQSENLITPPTVRKPAASAATFDPKPLRPIQTSDGSWSHKTGSQAGSSSSWQGSVARQQAPPLSTNRIVTAAAKFSARQGRLNQQQQARVASVRYPRRSGDFAVRSSEPAVARADPAHPLAQFINSPAQPFSPLLGEWNPMRIRT